MLSPETASALGDVLDKSLTAAVGAVLAPAFAIVGAALLLVPMPQPGLL
jgi:hypothetical protein